MRTYFFLICFGLLGLEALGSGFERHRNIRRDAMDDADIDRILDEMGCPSSSESASSAGSSLPRSSPTLSPAPSPTLSASASPAIVAPRKSPELTHKASAVPGSEPVTLESVRVHVSRSPRLSPGRTVHSMLTPPTLLPMLPSEVFPPAASAVTSPGPSSRSLNGRERISSARVSRHSPRNVSHLEKTDSEHHLVSLSVSASKPQHKERIPSGVPSGQGLGEALEALIEKVDHSSIGVPTGRKSTSGKVTISVIPVT